jgi:hypothetical protein
MKRIILLITLLSLVAAALLTAVPTFAQTNDDYAIIKNGRLQLLVEETDVSIQSALRQVERLNGYVLSQEIHEDAARYRYATLTFAVPSSQFETLLNALKPLGTVQDEQVTGEEMTYTAVDMESKLANLYANQERVRLFLEQTNHMSETLHIHQQLLLVENEISSLQGQKNKLDNRAAVSTITLRLVPVIPPAVVPPTPPPTPIPPAKPWHPADTAKLATVKLTETSQTVADLFIYRLIVWLPWLILLTLLALVYRRFGQRLHQSPTIRPLFLKEVEADPEE